MGNGQYRLCQHSPLPPCHVCGILCRNAENVVQLSGLPKGNGLMRQGSVRFQQSLFSGIHSPHDISRAAMTSGLFRNFSATRT